MNQTVRLAVQEQYLRGETMIEKWQHAQALGFDAIELRGAGEGRFAARLPELREAAAAGVPMPTVCVEMLHFVGDFDAAKRRDAIEQMKAQLSVMAEIGGRLAMTPASYGMFSTRLPPFVSPRSVADDHAVLIEGFGELAAHAEQVERGDRSGTAEPIREPHDQHAGPGGRAVRRDRLAVVRYRRRHLPHEHRGSRSDQGAVRGRGAGFDTFSSAIATDWNPQPDISTGP